MRIPACVLIIFLVVGCASEPKQDGPPWIHQPTRTVDSGFIVYVGSDTDNRADRAQFKAEGQALEDLANECSLIAKGARIEDRYTASNKGESTSYVKLALEFQECEEAKHANDPDSVRRVANVQFTEQLRKYQDLVETGEMDGTAVAQVEPGEEVQPPPPLPPVGGNPTTTQIFVARQYVAYQKEIVILSPPTYYAVNSPAANSFTQHIGAASEQIHTIEVANPAVRNQAWSRLPDRPVVARPPSLSPPSMRAAAPGGFARPGPEVHPPSSHQPDRHWNAPPRQRSKPIPPKPGQVRRRKRHPSDKK